MLKHVLVPLDGSQVAEKALKYALDIVDPQGTITLVSAVDVPEVPLYGYYTPINVPDYQKAVEEMAPAAKKYLDSVAAQFGESAIRFMTEAHVGDPAEVIITTAEKYGVDAIVMSTHGRSGLSRWIMGSVTNKVLNARTCPVFVVPAVEDHTPNKAQKAVQAGVN
jgi:nucleotide-binding universal stress UspA family protein